MARHYTHADIAFAGKVLFYQQMVHRTPEAVMGQYDIRINSLCVPNDRENHSWHVLPMAGCSQTISPTFGFGYYTCTAHPFSQRCWVDSTSTHPKKKKKKKKERRMREWNTASNYLTSLSCDRPTFSQNSLLPWGGGFPTMIPDFWECPSKNGHALARHSQEWVS